MNREALLVYARETYGAEAEYLWSRFPNYAVLRHSSNRKWYAIVMTGTGQRGRSLLSAPGQ